jgi:tetratricopeptide (TPR) repeat protein
MTMKRFLFLASAIVLFACSETPKNASDLGVVNLELQGAPEAVEAFNKGLLLLHSFEYEDARESFRTAIAIDSTMAMAYWGEAMTFNHPIWHRQEPDSARASMSRRAMAGAESNSELEADFLESLEVLYQEDLEKENRDVAYSEFYAEMSESYPKNHEVQSFYALSLMGSVPDVRDLEVYGKAGEVAAQIVKENPQHPGALHYMIHAYDDPAHAKLAMEAAQTYAQVAPSASHALHMPSHIFVAEGMWDEVISSNVDSYQASVDRMVTKGLDDDARGYHAYHWLQYGYLQKGEFQTAEDMVDSLQVYAETTPSKKGRSYLIRLQGTYLAETGAWDSPYADLEVDASDLNMVIKANQYFVRAMKSYSTGDSDSLNAMKDLLEALIRRESLFADTLDFKLCIPSDLSTARPSDIAASKAILYQIYALGFMLSSEGESAEEFLVKSTELEDSGNYSYGPPSIQKPTHEFYADWLLSKLRFEEALAEYEKALERCPGRRLSTLGKQAASAGIAEGQTAEL